MRRPFQILLLLLILQLALAALLLARGFPYYGSSLVSAAPGWELPIAIYHFPAIQTLSAAGLCCGLGKGSVLPLRVHAGHIPMRLSGTLLLSLTNWLCWSTVTLLWYWLWWLRRRRTAATPPGEGSP